MEDGLEYLENDWYATYEFHSTDIGLFKNMTFNNGITGCAYVGEFITLFSRDKDYIYKLCFNLNLEEMEYRIDGCDNISQLKELKEEYLSDEQYEDIYKMYKYVRKF